MIRVKKINELEFKADVNGMDFNVSLDQGYYEKLTSGKIGKEELIKRSFEFLLEREPKESILKNFNLKVIQRYFPEYEKTLKV